MTVPHPQPDAPCTDRDRIVGWFSTAPSNNLMLILVGGCSPGCGNFGTDIIANTMYKELFANGQPARSAAVAVVLLLATVPVMVLNVKRFKQQEEVR